MWTHASHLQDVLQLSLSRPLVVFQSFNGSSHLYYDWSNIGSSPRVYVVLYITQHDILWMIMLRGLSNFHPPPMSATGKRLQFFCWLRQTRFSSSVWMHTTLTSTPRC
jgi:hypothetical protein